MKLSVNQHNAAKFGDLSMKLPLLSFAITVLAFTSCAPTYTCGDFPDAVCQSVAETYAQSNDPATSPNGGISRPAHSGAVPLASDSTHPAADSPAQDYGQGDGPFLTRPRLLRIMLTPWEDKHQDLHAGGYIYLRLQDSQWVIPK